MSSVKTPNNKFNLINSRIKYGTDGGINVESGTLVVNQITTRVGINTINPSTTFDVSGSFKSTSIIDYSNSTGNNTQILTKVNGQNLWSYSGNNFNGGDMFPENTGDIVGPSIPIIQPSGFWSGISCLGPDGLIYASPRSGNPVYVFNPYNNTLDVSTYANATGDFVGCCAAPNGKIYFAPGNSSFVGILDTLRKTWDNTTISSSRYPNLETTTTNGKFWRCTLAPNGRIFMTPRSATWIGVVDTNNDTYTSIDISNITGASLNGLNYVTAANAKNGFLYMFPYTNSYPIVKINPVDLSFSQISQVFPLTSYLGAVTGPDGNPYGIPGNNATQRIRGIDVSGDIFMDSPDLNKTSAFFPQGANGGVVSLQGEIWFPPNSYGTSTPENLGKYNVFTRTFTYYNIPVSQRNQILRRVGAVLAPNGKLYFMPNFRDGSISDQRVFALKTGVPTQDRWMIAPNFNQSG
jgi:hypothetical protein